MAEYLHGAYGQQEASGISVPAKAGTLPVYFGVAPVHQLTDYAGTVKTPVVLRSASQARAAVGYAADWDLFSLGEALYLHFMSAEPVGPIAVVNLLDPDVHRTESQTTKNVTFVNGRAEIPTQTAILKTVAVDGQTGVTAAYSEDGASLVLTDPEGALSGSQSVSYYEVDTTALAAAVSSDFAGMIAAAAPLVYEIAGTPPSIFCAPGHSAAADVDTALKNAARKINGHWNAFVYSDLDCSTADTVDKAIAAKASALHNDARECPCWPVFGDGTRWYHGSALSVYRAMLVDLANGNVPYETASNKEIPITGVYTGSAGNYTPLRLDKQEADRLNSKGIRTAIFWGGSWRLWGPHTGAYDFNAFNAAEEIFDCSVRMALYLGNQFALSYGDEVDKPMHRARIDQILDREQERLDALVNDGALLYGRIEFNEDANPDSDLISGQFTFETRYTSTPAGRAIINRYRYTTTGLQALTSGGESE